jgi:hypothetical protein
MLQKGTHQLESSRFKTAHVDSGRPAEGEIQTLLFNLSSVFRCLWWFSFLLP